MSALLTPRNYIPGLARIMKPTKIIYKGERGTRKSNRGGEFYQSTLYEYIEISQ
jgi:hypothetical protein